MQWNPPHQKYIKSFIIDEIFIKKYLSQNKQKYNTFGVTLDKKYHRIQYPIISISGAYVNYDEMIGIFYDGKYINNQNNGIYVYETVHTNYIHWLLDTRKIVNMSLNLYGIDQLDGTAQIHSYTIT